jgi:serine/threonine protein kinase
MRSSTSLASAPALLHGLLKIPSMAPQSRVEYSRSDLSWINRIRQNVSIKVVVARKSGDDNRELAILRAVKEKGDPHHPGRKHVAHFLDSFYVQGPNGRHLCIISELLGPKASYVAESSPGCRIGGHLARQVSRPLLLAVDYLHSCGIAHGGEDGNGKYSLSAKCLPGTRYPHGKCSLPPL